MNLCGGLNFDDASFGFDGDKIILKGSGVGVDGREVELARISDALQWRYVGDEEWKLLIFSSELKGDEGEKGVKGDTGAKGDNGLGVKDINLTVDVDGKVTSGTSTLTDNSTIPITVTIA